MKNEILICFVYEYGFDHWIVATQNECLWIH